MVKKASTSKENNSKKSGKKLEKQKEEPQKSKLLGETKQGDKFIDEKKRLDDKKPISPSADKLSDKISREETFEEELQEIEEQVPKSLGLTRTIAPVLERANSFSELEDIKEEFSEEKKDASSRNINYIDRNESEKEKHNKVEYASEANLRIANSLVGRESSLRQRTFDRTRDLGEAFSARTEFGAWEQGEEQGEYKIREAKGLKKRANNLPFDDDRDYEV